MYIQNENSSTYYKKLSVFFLYRMYRKLPKMYFWVIRNKLTFFKCLLKNCKCFIVTRIINRRRMKSNWNQFFLQPESSPQAVPAYNDNYNNNILCPIFGCYIRRCFWRDSIRVSYDETAAIFINVWWKDSIYHDLYIYL